jgi:glycosyltransferase involved in cell wall biosynthesis
LRILTIIQCTNLGGMEQASLRLMQALQRRGHELSVVSLHPLGPIAPQFRASGIPAIGLGYDQVPLWRWLVRLRRELRRQAPEALLLTGHSLPVLLAIAGRCRGRRLLAIHFHHTGVRPRWFWRIYYELARGRVNTITFPSDFVRQEAVDLCPALESKAVTVRNPITPVAAITPSERRAARASLGLSADATIIGNAGWLIPRKRFDVFLRVAALVLRQRPDARFLIAGDGPERTKLEALAIDLDIADAVLWIGWTDNMREVYASLDLLLFNSDWDAMGLTPIEAAVHGVPIVSSVLHGGLAEVFSPGVDAVLFDQHDLPALAAAVLRVLANPTAATAMAAQARDHVLGLSDPDRLAAWHEQVLQQS